MGNLSRVSIDRQFEGTPFYPENDRYWSIVDKYRVTQFYTAPTAIRSLMKFGDDLVKRHDLSSLKVYFVALSVLHDRHAIVLRT